MQINEIREKWKFLSVNGGQQIRVSKDCLPELFLSIDEDGNRRLILWLIEKVTIDFQSCHKEKISIEYFPVKKAILLKLNDKNFLDLFDDLILSIINHIQAESNNAQYPKVMFSTFHKWSSFFEECKADTLSQEVIKGIWGELFVVYNLLLKAENSLLYNDILSSWKGPYRKGHDFETDNTDIEVKTKEITKQSVKISSEYQLNEQNSKPLDLLVLSVQSEMVGKSLNDLYLEIKDLIQNGNGDISILLAALSEVKISTLNITIYDNYRYTAIEQITYDCCNPDFPRFIPNNLKSGQFNVQYELLLSKIDGYINDRIQFDEVSE